jgi:hypothetical protein
MTVHVSDHALIRWLERFGGVDMDFFRSHISGLVKEAIDAGATSVTIDGYVYTLSPKKRTVITVLEPQMRAKRSQKFMRGTTEQQEFRVAAE